MPRMSKRPRRCTERKFLNEDCFEKENRASPLKGAPPEVWCPHFFMFHNAACPLEYRVVTALAPWRTYALPSPCAPQQAVAALMIVSISIERQ